MTAPQASGPTGRSEHHGPMDPAERTGLRAAFPGVRRTARHLSPQLRGQRFLIAGGFLALVAEIAFRLLEPWPLKFVLDSVIAPGAGNRVETGGLVWTLLWCACAVIAFAGLRALSAYLMTVAFSVAGARVVTALRGQLYAHLQRLSLRWHGRSRVGDLLTRLTGDIGRLQEVAVTAALPLVGNVVTLVAMSVVMVVMDWRLALVVLAAFPVFVSFSRRQTGRIRAAARESRLREGELAGTAAETLGAIKLVQAYSLEHVLQRRFDESNIATRRTGVRATRLSAGLERRTDLLVGIATAAVLFVGGLSVVRGRLTPGDLVVFVSYLKGAFKPMRDMAKYTGRIAKAAASGERVVDVLGTGSDLTDAPSARPAPRWRGEVVLDRVSATYDGERWALRDVSVRVPAGSRVGVVGGSGAGKSTIAGLLLRLQDPARGRVLIDGVDLRAYTLASTRAQVAIVLQESVLFATTIAENIRYGAPNATDEQIRGAAYAANVEEFVRRLPDGYATVVCERGASLSGGQRQRIAIARALLRDAPVVILDEATAGLDPDNCAEVNQALTRLTHGRTTFVISHDYEAVRDCDHIIALEDGRLTAYGPPATVLGPAPTPSAREIDDRS